jgi:hypothetical protein
MPDPVTPTPSDTIRFPGILSCDGATSGQLRLRSAELILDVYGGALPRGLPTALSGAELRREAGERWSLVSGAQRWELGDARVFVHQDLSRQAAALIPPRRVPLGKRLFWSSLLTLLRTEAGRRWVQRRYRS